jgi:uridine kinase
MIVSIEGNIGSGKTTLLAELKRELGEYIGRVMRIV